jgi:hypothetical protein
MRSLVLNNYHCQEISPAIGGFLVNVYYVHFVNSQQLPAPPGRPKKKALAPGIFPPCAEALP